jgi:type VI secretion system protein ImpH
MSQSSVPSQNARPLSWGSGDSPQDRLFHSGSAFNFYQAVRLLFLLYPASSGNAEDAQSMVRFRSQMGFHFPGAEIEQIQQVADKHAIEMTVNFLGLAGAYGPLPTCYTETLLNNRNSALREFLDLFNHRIILLLYRIHALHHPELTNKPPAEGLLANHLFALIGMGRDPESSMRNRMSFPDQTLLHYAGLMTQRTRSASGLAAMLSDCYQVEVEIEEFAGAWAELAEEQCTRLGAQQGCNQILGDGAMLGRRVWDQNSGIAVRLGPMDLQTYLCFLPRGKHYRSLQDVIRLYLSEDIDFTIKLVLREDQIPVTVIGGLYADSTSITGARLGWLSWLKSDTSNSGGAPRLIRMPAREGRS